MTQISESPQIAKKQRVAKLRPSTVFFFLLLWTIQMNFLASRSIQEHSYQQVPKVLHESSNPRKNVSKEENPLLTILKYANVTLSTEDEAALPQWDEITSRFGSKPRIIGLEKCHEYRQNIRKRNRIVAPAGLFNSGTNVLHEWLKKNCMVHFKTETPPRYGVDWQVNWGKHEPPSNRLKHIIHENRNNSNILPIVLVREPWTWLQSMCRNAYAAHWYHVEGKHCPNLRPNNVEREWFRKSRRHVFNYFNQDPVATQNVVVKAGFQLGMDVIPLFVAFSSGRVWYKSLIHLWKDWYQEYFDASFPRLIVRLEDLVFHPHEVLSSICSCAGGSFNEENFTINSYSTKGRSDNMSHKRTRGTGLVSSFSLHTVGANRTTGMSLEDIRFANTVLQDSLAPTFGYRLDP